MTFLNMWIMNSINTYNHVTLSVGNPNCSSKKKKNFNSMNPKYALTS